MIGCITKLKMMKKQLLVLSIILLLQNSSAQLEILAEIISGATMVVNLIKTITSGVESVKHLFVAIEGDQSTNDQAIREIMDEHRRELLSTFEILDTKMDHLKLYIGDRFKKIQEVINQLPQILDITLKKQTVGAFITTISNKWDEIMLFLKLGIHKDVYHHVMSSHLQYMEHNLMQFRFAISPDKTDSLTTNGLLMEIAMMHKNQRDIMCNGQTSHHNIIHLSQMVVVAEIKAFILQVLALNEAYPANNSWTPLAHYSLTILTKQLQEYNNESKIALMVEKTPYIRACDTEDQHHHEVSNNKKLIYHPNADYDSEKSPRQQHSVLLPLDRTCFTFEPSMFGCDTLEKIEPIHYHLGLWSGGSLVAYSQCERDILSPLEIYNPSTQGRASWETATNTDDCKVKSVQKWIGHVCTCTCKIYDKLILSLMQSRLRNNYIVVAAQFQKTQNYIYIQIAEGKLEANGYISSFSWIPPTQKENGENPLDASLTINEGKTMALDDLQLPLKYVLTGIKFSRQVISGDKGFRIGLHGVKFNWSTGQLDLTDETFVIASDMAKTEYPLVEFRSSDYKHSNSPRKLPSLNGASVEPNPLSPIGGVGVFYETILDKPPRISLRLFTIDYMFNVDNSKKLDPSCPLIF